MVILSHICRPKVIIILTWSTLQLFEGDLYNYESVKEAISGWYVYSKCLPYSLSFIFWILNIRRYGRFYLRRQAYCRVWMFKYDKFILRAAMWSFLQLVNLNFVHYVANLTVLYTLRLWTGSWPVPTTLRPVV